MHFLWIFGKTTNRVYRMCNIRSTDLANIKKWTYCLKNHYRILKWSSHNSSLLFSSSPSINLTLRSAGVPIGLQFSIPNFLSVCFIYFSCVILISPFDLWWISILRKCFASPKSFTSKFCLRNLFNSFRSCSYYQESTCHLCIQRLLESYPFFFLCTRMGLLPIYALRIPLVYC